MPLTHSSNGIKHTIYQPFLGFLIPKNAENMLKKCSFYPSFPVFHAKSPLSFIAFKSLQRPTKNATYTVFRRPTTRSKATFTPPKLQFAIFPFATLCGYITIKMFVKFVSMTKMA